MGNICPGCSRKMRKLGHQMKVLRGPGSTSGDDESQSLLERSTIGSYGATRNRSWTITEHINTLYDPNDSTNLDASSRSTSSGPQGPQAPPFANPSGGSANQPQSAAASASTSGSGFCNCFPATLQKLQDCLPSGATVRSYLPSCPSWGTLKDFGKEPARPEEISNYPAARAEMLGQILLLLMIVMWTIIEWRKKNPWEISGIMALVSIAMGWMVFIARFLQIKYSPYQETGGDMGVDRPAGELDQSLSSLTNQTVIRSFPKSTPTWPQWLQSATVAAFGAFAFVSTFLKTSGGVNFQADKEADVAMKAAAIATVAIFVEQLVKWGATEYYVKWFNKKDLPQPPKSLGKSFYDHICQAASLSNAQLWSILFLFNLDNATRINEFLASLVTGDPESLGYAFQRSAWFYAASLPARYILAVLAVLVWRLAAPVGNYAMRGLTRVRQCFGASKTSAFRFTPRQIPDQEYSLDAFTQPEIDQLKGWVLNPEGTYNGPTDSTRLRFLNTESGSLIHKITSIGSPECPNYKKILFDLSEFVLLKPFINARDSALAAKLIAPGRAVLVKFSNANIVQLKTAATKVTSSVDNGWRDKIRDSDVGHDLHYYHTLRFTRSEAQALFDFVSTIPAPELSSKLLESVATPTSTVSSDL